MHKQGVVEAGPETALLSSFDEWAPDPQRGDNGALGLPNFGPRRDRGILSHAAAAAVCSV